MLAKPHKHASVTFRAIHTPSRVKTPVRPAGGVNVSERYKRLEQSLRAKEIKKDAILSMERMSHQIDHAAASPILTNPETVFHGFVVPKEPKPPADDECCMSGCAVCVYDLYEEELQSYKGALATLRASLTSSKIPETEWPQSIRPSYTVKQKARPIAEVSMNAFAAFEASLKGKKGVVYTTFHDYHLRTENSVANESVVRPPESRRKPRFLSEAAEALRWLVFSNR
ncbi:oxidoreductase-like protein [Flagelloscypha sp. PMI_526]|nr:oxidoreductase-like protein [Flagelloscypha sp. PMI_526]